MANNQGEPPLDLEQILATLRSLPQTGVIPDQSQHQSYGFDQPLQPLPGESTPSAPEPAPAPAPQPTGQVQSSKEYDPTMSGQSYLADPPIRWRVAKKEPVLPAAHLVDWRYGLRCVTQITANDPNIVHAIKKLMKDQERHVQQWEAGRDRLIEEQKMKKENEQTHRAALSLPGLLQNTPLLRTPEREQEELVAYDRKVYRACCAMVEAQSAELKNLGIPFFCLRPERVLPEGVEPTPLAPGDFDGGMYKRKISRKQLLELQRKMLNHLALLYED